ncbi:hypothetical protein B296_00042837 [Ensete ventricosum]|uniref:Uncharacterized protein n=1 Tax=Ensete ventricosum TaxID=4639 RepID=A0A426XCP0_ENSVE|nr:hypothetical protein B296_00042837 [Ensete ventricosum]
MIRCTTYLSYNLLWQHKLSLSLTDFSELSINVLVLRWFKANQELSLELSPRKDSVIGLVQIIPLDCISFKLNGGDLHLGFFRSPGWPMVRRQQRMAVVRTATTDGRRQWPWPARDADAAAATVFWMRKRGQQSRRRLRQQQREERNRGGRRKRRSRGEGSGDVWQERRKGRFSRRKQRRGQQRQVMGRRRRRTATTLAMGDGRQKTAANEGRKGGSEGPGRATAAEFDEEARKVRTAIAGEGEGGGCGVSVRSAQQWLRLRAREAAAATTLADGRSKRDGATAETTLVDGRSRGDGVTTEVLTTDEGGEEDRAEGVRLLRQERRKGRGQWMRRHRPTAGAEEEGVFTRDKRKDASTILIIMHTTI